MRLVIDFLSRFTIRSKPSELFITSPAVEPHPQATPDGAPIQEVAAAIFAPIFASLDRIEKLIDQLPDKPTAAPV